jgi:two-component system chemotaxis sensor kinase CheA
VHDAETSYDILRKDENAVWERQKLLEELDQVEQKINYYGDIFEDKLAGFSGSREGRFIEKSLLDEIDCVVHDADDLLQQNDRHQLAEVEGIVIQLRNVLGAIAMESLKNILEPVSDSLPSMAYDLGKLEPAVVLNDNGIRFSEDIVPLLKNVFMHIFRNSIDHGLEPVAERVAAGKPKRGTIELEVRHERGKLVFCVSDDGRGLNLWAIKQKAIANGMVAELDELSDENLAQLIFHSGLSTADSITIVSGRGVGMHAVRQFLESKGGAIEIRFTGERNDVGYRPIELIVTLPGSESVQLKKAA